MPKAEYLQFGGQAIVEGVMMRSPKFFAVACRAPNGKILVRTEELEKTWIGRQKWLKLPFLRGTLALLDSMALANRSMKFASQVQMDPAFAEEGSAAAKEPAPSQSIQSAAIVGTLILSLAIGIFIFQFIPQTVAQFTGRGLGDSKGTVTNYIAEVVKIVLFLGYLKLISLMPAIQEVFRYHGAEHKAINVAEAEQELTMENAQAMTRLHPRCGTSFAVIVMLIGFVLLPLVPRYPVTGQPGQPFLDITVRVLIELCIIPIIAGLSYELLRLAGRMRNEKWVQIAFSPGLASQKYLTTIEPEPKHLEVALASLKAVVHAEKTGELTHTDDYEAEGLKSSTASAGP